jgi:hypothetical protein
MLTAVEIRGREIRRKNFAVLAAVAALIPSSGDAEGHACGTLTVGAIADAAKVTRSQVRRTLAWFRRMRVLWLRYQKPAAFEVRFQRQVVVGLLAAQRVCPREAGKLMLAHRRKRETAAPFVRLDGVCRKSASEIGARLIASASEKIPCALPLSNEVCRTSDKTRQGVHSFPLA